MLTVCTLLYGDYPVLATRCLTSLEPYLRFVGDVRIGLNACGEATKQFVASLAACYPQIHVETSDENIYKYPMMRRLFDVKPLEQLTAWFDDDSFILPESSGWFERVRHYANRKDFDMAGSTYVMQLRGNQIPWIMDQPWYRGRPFNDDKRVRFCTGGYWLIRSEILNEHRWPVQELRHRGGDVMLGVLLEQNGLSIANDKMGVAINADADGRESKSPRRGYDETPVGVHYKPTSTRS